MTDNVVFIGKITSTTKETTLSHVFLIQQGQYHISVHMAFADSVPNLGRSHANALAIEMPVGNHLALVSSLLVHSISKAHMDVSEIDWRIEPLHDVFVGIDAGLAAIRERLANEDGFDGLFACEHAEPLFGLAFVAAQTYAVGTVSDLNSVRMSGGKPKKEKLECYECDSIRVKGGVTRIQLINATANYFKHHDEWTRWPTRSDRGAHDIRMLGSVGITEQTEFPCIDAVNLICGTGWELIVLHQIVKEWRADLFSCFR